MTASPIPCDPAGIPRLRVGRKVPRHVYLQYADEPSDADEPLFTVPTDGLAEQIVAGLEALRVLNMLGIPLPTGLATRWPPLNPSPEPEPEVEPDPPRKATAKHDTLGHAARDALALAEVRRLVASGEAQRIREGAGLDQAEVARAVGVSRPTLARWESGSRRPQGEPALRLLALLQRLRNAGTAS